MIGNYAKNRATSTDQLNFVKLFGSGSGHWPLFYIKSPVFTNKLSNRENVYFKEACASICMLSKKGMIEEGEDGSAVQIMTIHVGSYVCEARMAKQPQAV